MAGTRKKQWSCEWPFCNELILKGSAELLLEGHTFYGITENHELKPWILKAYFHGFEEEPLLHLLLGALPGCSPFSCVDGKQFTVAGALDKLSNEGIQFESIFANVTEKRNDGNRLEATGIMVLTIASRMYGLDGQPASQFLGGIAAQFNRQHFPDVDVTFDVGMRNVSSFLKEMTIPFSFTLLENPDEKKSASFYNGFGYFWRTKAKEFDFNSNIQVSGESERLG